MTGDRPMTWTLLFEPLGVLLFRDDRPFDAGDHSLAVSRFPLPSVFRGAVRTALFESVEGANFHVKPGFCLSGSDREILGGADLAEAFDIRGPMVARTVNVGRYEYLLPWPHDLVVTRVIENDETPKVLGTEVMHARAPHVHGPTCRRIGPPHGKDRSRDFVPLDQALPWTRTRTLPKFKGKPWLTAAGADAYVKHSSGSDPTLELVEGRDFIEQKDFLAQETRVGIARATETLGERLVAADSMFYTMIAWRMSPRVRFAVEVGLGRLREEGQIKRLQDLLGALQGRLVRLGGKSGHARMEVIEGSIAPSWAQPDPVKASPSSKLWLWTPGLYDPGTLPGVATVLGETLRLGGFDMANRCPRPLQGALERGSVLWFSALDHQALANHQQALAKTHDLPVQSYGYGQWIPRSNR